MKARLVFLGLLVAGSFGSWQARAAVPLTRGASDGLIRGCLGARRCVSQGVSR